MATLVTAGDSTVDAMRRKVRRLTASASESALATIDIDRGLNTFINQDFPYAIKLDAMRSVYTFFTEPYRDRYPLDINYNQGVRAPAYVEGIQSSFYKDRQQFNMVWPRFPTLFKPISGDGTTLTFNFTIPGPFLSKEVVLGGIDKNGTPITVNDDGNGNLLFEVPNSQISVPTALTVAPGMFNQNTANPGQYTKTIIGSVNYVTGIFSITFPIAPIAGQQMTLWVSQYMTGRPLSILFWNNEFIIRPVPKLIHKIEVETFLTPVQFMLSTDVPILTQWWQYIAYGCAMEILRERQDMAGVEALREGFERQEALVLERQGVDELFIPSPTIFNSPSSNYYGPWGNDGSYNG